MTSRGYCFTTNNPTIEDLDNYDKIIEYHAFKYLIYGEELGENGTPHHQGYIHFTTPIRFAAVKKLLPKSHIEKRRGSTNEAITYCKKDGIYREFGSVPESSGDSTKSKWKQIIEWAKAGDMGAIEEANPAIYLRYMSALRGLRIPNPIILPNLDNEWWYGRTGTGKSRKLWNEYPNHYQKELNKWWCGYNYESIVAIEEWSPKNECTGSMLKIWADRYPFTAQIKGGSMKKIRPDKIIVLSNYTIKECFPNSQDHEPLLRRFKQIEFISFFDPYIEATV
nr:MAG: replication associated protein [Arizlama virus]